MAAAAQEISAPIAEVERKDDPLWFKDAVIYQLHVKAFFDANGDGIGDFAGLAQNLDYIQGLGVDTLWLLPFYPSPQRDDGYDIADYLGVHPDYGTLDDFKHFIDQAHQRGLRVITELVINHTSDQHPWFKRARAAPKGSPERDFYVWSDDDKKFAGTRIIFTDTETSNWTWDPQAGQYYWHRFFSHQPDLNHNNPAVVDAVIDVMRFWLDLGVDGMRLDAIPYLCVREGTNNENLPETHAVLRKMRAVVDANYKNRMFLAEANQWPEDVREYFGEGDECHVAYHFPLMPRMFMALATEDRYPIAEILRQTPEIPDNCQWAIFLRNHDELTLEMVTDRERDYMYKMYAQEPRMRVNVGIRRRLAPLLNNDVDRIKLMNALLLSMPGSPILYYGDEIGMGDNIYVGDRNGVRTPLQWSIDRNAGFSRSDPQRLYLPVIMDPIYGYQSVNIEAQTRDPSSLLNWTKRMLAVRRRYQSFGRGTLDFIRPQNRKVLAYVRSYGNEIILCVVNLAQTAQAVELDLSAYKGRVPVELTGWNTFPPIGDLPYFLTLPAHAFFWLLLSDQEQPPAWHVERLPATELPVLVMPEGLATLSDGIAHTLDRAARRTLKQLEDEVLPEFLHQRRWFAAKGRKIEKTTLGSRMLWKSPEGTWLVTLVGVELAEGVHQRYLLPLSLSWEDGPGDVLRTAEWTLGKVREAARVGVLVDAFADPQFCLSAVRGVEAAAAVPFGDGELKFTRTSVFEELAARGVEPVHYPGREQSNTSVILGESLFLKAYRQSRSGINPDVEMPRFLMEAGYKSIAPLAGAIEFVQGDGAVTTFAALFAYVRNQGDGWAYALNHLERASASLYADAQEQVMSPLFMAQMQTLGKRVGELHAVLARPTGNPDFRPEPVEAKDTEEWTQTLLHEVDVTFEILTQRLPTLPDAVQPLARALLDARQAVVERSRALITRTPRDLLKTRYHGDLHLGQALLTADDFLITDFEGEPARSMDERRRKGSPLRDVAGMLRSFDYARVVATDRVVAQRPDLRERVEPVFEAWHGAACAAFMRGYRAGVGASRSVPSDERDLNRLIEFFTMEKALYELRYEIENRPHWLGAPAKALLALIGREERAAA